MAGNKFVSRKSTVEDGFIDRSGAIWLDLPIVEVVINGNIKPNDEWALFRLTDDGMWAYYEIGCEMAVGILGLSIKNKSAVEELSPRYKTEEEAKQVKAKMSAEEQKRILICSVRPRKM